MVAALAAPVAAPPSGPAPAVTVVVPVYNGAAVLERCLTALAGSGGLTWECVVVDDGSTDDSAGVARRHGATVVRTAHARSGPGQARNLGAQSARAPLLCFIDADVVVRPDTLAQFATLFAADPNLGAAFGSYDTRPAEPGLLSQYRNLLHHYVHQHGREAASTFWSGCGAIRRDLFLDFEGFSAAFERPSIEDIELGYRLRAAGQRITLAKHIQVTHLKRWTFAGILKTDVRDRAYPWAVLIRRSGRLPDDLNVGLAGRISAVSVYALAVLLALGAWRRPAWLALPVPLAALLACNWDFYRFLATQRGPGFLLGALPMHWLYFAYATAAFAVAVVTTRQPAGGEATGGHRQA